MNLGTMMQPQGVPGPQAAATPTGFAASGYAAQSVGGSVSGSLDGTPAAWLLALVAASLILLHYGR